jgi:hypothetical protein
VKRGLLASAAAEQVGVVVVESFMVIRKVTVVTIMSIWSHDHALAKAVTAGRIM